MSRVRSPQHLGAHPPVPGLDRGRGREKVGGRQGGLNLGDGVQVCRRGDIHAGGLHRGGLDEPRGRKHPHARHRREVGDGLTNCALAVAQVAAQREDRDGGCAHARVRSMVIETSSNGTWIGAEGLCSVTRTRDTASCASATWARRSATVSIRSTGSLSTAATTSLGEHPVVHGATQVVRARGLPRVEPDRQVDDELLPVQSFVLEHPVVRGGTQTGQGQLIVSHAPRRRSRLPTHRAPSTSSRHRAREHPRLRPARRGR